MPRSTFRRFPYPTETPLAFPCNASLRLCLCLCLCLCLLGLAACGPVGADDTVQFSREVLPLLSDRCFHCHGPDEGKREADLRLDIREAAIASGAIVPGKPDESRLLARVQSSDDAERMPPVDSHRLPLTEKQTATLARWIRQGAPWGRHWAFESPRKRTTEIEAGDRPAGANPIDANPIDFFVSKKLREEKLSLSPRASLETLARRASFDLTGLPPTTDELQAVLSDTSPNPFANHVDRLLKSRHYGERMAMWWLDVARYSDTDGYQQDATRTNWPWRDWVIDAFNANMPFDQFTIEQFAGDLLPNATPSQILATCFHRNHMTNGEGGRDPEESRIDYVLDRVNTTGSVWLGLTLGCSQCHSHKFDPIAQTDYYQLFAFFNSIDEDGKAGGAAKPYLKYKSPYAARAVQEATAVVEQRQVVEQKAKELAAKDFEIWLSEQVTAFSTINSSTAAPPFKAWHTLDPKHVQTIDAVEGTRLQQLDDGAIKASGPNPFQDDYRIIARSPLARVTGIRLEVLPDASHTEGKLSRGATGEFILTDVKLQLRQIGKSQVRDIELANAVADAEKKVSGRNYGKVQDTLDDDPRNGWTTESHDGQAPHTAVFALAAPLPIADDEELLFVMLHRSTRGDANIGKFRLSVTDQAGDAVRSLAPMPLTQLAIAVENLGETGSSRPAEVIAELAPALRARLLAQFLADHTTYQRVKSELDAANAQLGTVKRAASELKVMVLGQRAESRETHVLNRGVWDQKGVAVQTGVPAAILPWPAAKTRSRLDLAHWLVSAEHPLTSRVVVNHLWQICFGAGLVRTPEDFGLQGEFPTHPELLDWLAVELVEHDWDLQHVLRLMLASRTYQQSSETSAPLQERDPANRLLARGARYRLPAWMIRDAALQTSGLLNPAVGGPPTMPYQPPGVWEENFMGRFQYLPSQGPAQHRRTIYAFWRRASAPTFLFDSAQRRVCEVRTRRTNTPLHALTLLNDVNILEASRAIARESITHAGNEQRVRHLFRKILSRHPTEQEQQVLLQHWTKIHSHYRSAPESAAAFLEFGQPEHRASAHPMELASYTVLASMIYNLDEAMTHE